MCEYSDIDKAISIFQEAHCLFELMHSVSTYPMEDANLKCITILNEKYGCKVGYSGHEVGLAVSTHTIGHIPESRREDAMINLAKRVKTGGGLVLQCARSDIKYISKIEGMFSNNDRYYYRGLLSKIYENILENIFQTDAIGSLNTEGRFSLYRNIKYIILPMSLVLSLFDKYIKTSQVIIYYTGKNSVD